MKEWFRLLETEENWARKECEKSMFLTVTTLVPVPEEVQLPSPTSSEDMIHPVLPPHATTPGQVVSGQHCWSKRKADPSQGSGASSWLFWRSSSLQGKDCGRPYPVGSQLSAGGTRNWQAQAVKQRSVGRISSG